MLQQLIATSPTRGRGGGETEEEKYFGYPVRALSLLRDMESIRDQDSSEETAAAADEKVKEEEDKG